MTDRTTDRTTLTNPRLEAALQYARHDFSVIPVKGKTAFLDWKRWQTKRADEGQITAWWGQNPDANVAIVTGKISGISVVDCDTDEMVSKIEAILPDNLVTPIQATPGGGRHYCFDYDQGIRTRTGILPGLDTRSDGGYIVVEPSVIDGKRYAWMEGLNLLGTKPASLPNGIKDSFFNSLLSIKEGSADTLSDFLHEGRRDNDLFHIANLLIRGGATEEYVRKVLQLLAIHCSPPFPLSEVENKIQSAIRHAERREGTIAADVKEWVMTTTGHFLTTDCHRELNLTTRDHKKAAGMALFRLEQEGIIEKYGQKRGSYRRVECDAEVINFLKAPDAEFNVDLPLDLSGRVIIYPGSPVIIAGAKSSGKTAFALEIVRRNMSRYPVSYLCSELSDVELRKRLSLHPDLKLTDWNFKPLRVTHDWADYIDGSERLWIIDYIEEVQAEAWKVGGHIKAVHDKLKKGIAIIFLQKKADSDLARGATYTLDKARLYVALNPGQAKIVDCKASRGENPRGLKRDFKLLNGAKFMPKGDWHE